jgi:hypothetical protein
MDHGPYGSGWGREGIRHVVLNSITPGFILAPSFKIVFCKFRMGALGETQINCKHDNIINVDACLVDILLYSI